MHPNASSHPHIAPRQPLMADLWQEFPAMTGQLAPAVAHAVQAHAPLQVHPGMMLSQPDPFTRPRPYRDPAGWSLLKHLVQLALVASVALLVLQGGRSPLMAVAYVASTLLMMVVMVVADRQRFADRDPAFDIVEVVVPPPVQVPQPVVRQGPLVPLVHQMHVALSERVDVT